MHPSRGFSPAYFSLFGFLLYFQLVWVRQNGMYADIFLRSLLSFLLTAPLMYAVLLMIHVARMKLYGRNDCSGSLFPLYSFSLWYLYLFQYVSSQEWKHTPAVLFTLFGTVFTVAVLFPPRSRRTDDAPDRTGPGNSAIEIFLFMRNGFAGWFSSIRHALSHPVAVRGLVFFPVTWLLLAIQVILLIKFSTSMFNRPLLFPVCILTSLLMPVLLVQSLKALTLRVPFTGAVIFTFLLLLYYLLSLYQITEETPFDYSILHLNSDLMSSRQTWVLLLEKFRPQSFLFTLFFAVYLLLTGILGKKNREKVNRTLIPAGKSLSGAALYLMLFVLPLQSMDQLKNLGRSVKSFIDQEASLAAASALLETPYPYYRCADSSHSCPRADTLPNIFLVCLESCNGMLVEKRTEDGREITPVFNTLIPDGVYIEHFYGNSVQTARGFFAILSGTPPSYRKKVATSYPDLAFVSMPSVLSRRGYTTLFLKAYHDIGYDNTGGFMKKAGFEHVLSMTDDILTSEEKTMRWGWGLQDDYFYRKCFSILDSIYYRRPDSTGQRPFFVTTFNVSNHMMFQDIPAGQKYLYPGAGQADFRENYRNSMFLSDSCMREIITQINRREWLRNTMIIIVGDHGFPAGEHSIRNEKGAWEENFRTPFLLIWKGHVRPRRISGKAYSQTDILPTVFDLLGISPAHHAVGKSIFAEGPRDPVMLAQPYDGIYLVSIDYPFKYVKKISGNENFLFDLASDPGERSNLYTRNDLEPTVRKLQNSTAQLMLNQMLIEKNRLMPPR